MILRPIHRPRRAARRALCGVLAAICASGCSGLGPRALESNRTRYNIAIQRTDSEELLLNLVRLRYRDTPFFLQLSSVSANLRFRAAVGVGGQIASGGPDIASVDGNVAIEESPTITYTPLQGEKFVKQMLEPVDLEILLWLTYSGWSVDRALRLLVQEINGVPNAPTASGPTPTLAPEYAAFQRATAILRSLQQRGLLRLATSPGDLRDVRQSEERPRLYLILEPEALALDETREFTEQLGLTPGRRHYEIVVRLGPPQPDRLSIVPRSITAAMYYASQAVEVPEEDERAGWVTVTRDAAGQPFDWQQLTAGLIRVRSGGSASQAYVAVQYRGHWFYIDDADLDSKSTFALLHQVLALQSGGAPSATPILTLPVSR